MALLADRVKETTTTTGTGTVSLAGAPAGFQSFNTAFANGSLVYYVIQGGAEWEIGIGTTGTGTLARTQVLQSSNADALVPFSAGVKDVFCSYVADRAVTTVDAATLTNKTLDDYTNNVGANSTHFRIKATGTISKGTVVKATGYNPGEMAIEVAVVTSATDLVLGISEQALTAGQFGLAVVIGELFDVNTNGFTVGNIIYSNGAGGFTETKPSSGLYQALGWIVRANTSNGVIAVNVVAPLYVETATNTANTSVLRDGSGNFAAGTITATLSGTATQVSNALTAGTYLTSGGTYNGSAARTFAVDATDANTASKVVARDASGNFAAGTITATLSGTATQVSQALTAGSYLTSTGTYNGGTARTFAVDATDANTASKVVARDASGNFAAGTITAALSGNATTATTADKVANALTAGTYITSTGTFDGSAARTFSVDATDANTASKVVARDASGNFSAGTITATLNGAAPAGSLSGNTLASGVTASSLTSVGTLQNLTVSGDLTVDTNILFVDATNNRVGVGTTSPSAILHTVGANEPARFASSTTANFIGLYHSTTTLAGYIGNAAGIVTGGDQTGLGLRGESSIVMSVGANEALRVDSNRNLAVDTNTLYVDAANNRVGVGTASPTKTLTVQGDATFALDIMANSNGTATSGFYNGLGISGYDAIGWYGSNVLAIGGYRASQWNTIELYTAGTKQVTLSSTGNLGLGVTPSAWNASYRAFQVGQVGTFWAHAASADVYLSANYYFDTADRYIVNGAATSYRQNSGTHAWFTAPSGTAGNAISFTQAMTLDASGNLGVGATSPAFALGSGVQITRAGIATLRMENSTASNGLEIAIDSTANGVRFYGLNNAPFVFAPNATERARITSGGDFIVGATASDGYRVSTYGDFPFRAKMTGTATGSYSAFWHAADSGDNVFMYLSTDAGGSTRGSITYNRGGGVVAYNTTSDYRAKDVFGAWQDAGQTIDALTVYRGKMKGATIERPMLIAHEAQTVAPYCVTGEKDAVDADGNPIYQQMDHSVLVPLLIAEVQSLRARVAALEA